MAVLAVLLISFATSLEFAKICASPEPYPLDMAPNAVDDMYVGCRDQMDDRVKKEYLTNEKNKNKDFTVAWAKAEKNLKAPPSSPLKKEQIMAIYVYTLNEPNVYSDFNTAVRTQRSEYKTRFRYHTLHFYLTVALQTLKEKDKRCLKGYRRVNNYFSRGVLKKKIRFGSFTSSSMGQYAPSETFGDKSCFEIETCFGADISNYSKFPGERELLIPPYEVFKVTKIKLRSKQKNLPCEVVYSLKSTRKTQSNLNCAVLK